MAGMTPPRRPALDRWDDPELAQLFHDDPELYELSRTLRAARPEPELGSHFEPYLRARLMDAAARELQPRGLGRWLRPRPGVFAGGGAVLGAVMIAAVVVTTVLYRPNDTRVVTVGANVAENHSVSPDDVIRVSFSQAVDHGSIEHSLQIRPATSVQTRWEGTTLVITPLHHLAANTPYTVTIPKSAVRDESGHVGAVADIRFAFGTKATPTPGPSNAPAAPPTLQPQPLGAVSGDSRVLIAPDGSVVATSGVEAGNTTPSASPGVLPSSLSGPGSLLGSPTPAPGRNHGNASPTPAGGPSASPAAQPPLPTALIDFNPPAGNGPTQLGPAASAAAWSSNGRFLAYLVAHGDTADVVVARADGSGPTTLVHSADASSPLAWAGPDSLLYLSSGEQVSSLDLQGRTRPVGGLRIGEGQDLAFAPGGKVVYVGPQPSAVPSASPSADTGSASPTPGASASASPAPEVGGHLVDLATATITTLPGVRQLPAFSADGGTVAWIDEGGSVPVLDVMPTATGAQPTTVPTPATAGDTVGNLALDGDGGRIAYTLASGANAATPALRVVAVSSGQTLAVGDGQPAQSPVLSAAGDRIAFLRPSGDGVVAAAATIPGITPQPPAPDAVPADAAAILDQFVAAQRSGDTTVLKTLAAPSLTINSSLTPRVTRSYVITSALDPQAQTVTADVRLVHDATGTTPVSFADETLQLARPAAGQPFEVTLASVGAFQGVPAGPQVVHVSSGRDQGGALLVRITFDSDLDPATVTGSVITLKAAGVSVPARVTYDVETRTAVIRAVGALPAGLLTLSVGNGLHDVAGQGLSGGYSTTLQG